MIVTYSKSTVPIRISQERWEHITRRHPEMLNQKRKVIETISNPDLILAGDFGELLAVRLYSKTPLTRKYLVAACKEISNKDGFLLTAYFTNAPLKRRKVLWKP
ncbi:MAG: hypothetical protein QME66_02470 [Candidatus Eisenbacteria bacterium]|nr:hypothetical protein [Candidatus Eisenbacteria bacterium]